MLLILALTLATQSFAGGKTCFFKNRFGQTVGAGFDSAVQSISSTADCAKLCDLNVGASCGREDAKGKDLEIAICEWGDQKVAFKNSCPPRSASKPTSDRTGRNCYSKNKNGVVIGTAYTRPERAISRSAICAESCELDGRNYCGKKDARGKDLEIAKCAWGNEIIPFKNPCHAGN